MKQGSKNTSENKNGYGGARAGAGRHSGEFETERLLLNIPVDLLTGIENAGIDNRTAYVNYLIAKDLAGKATNEKSKKSFRAVAKSMQESIYTKKGK